MRVNIYDVAYRAGVSVVTVSRVINNVPTVRERNKQKVLKAMKELNYEPNAAARALARGKSGVIGLLTPSLEDAFFGKAIEAIHRYLMDQGYFLALSITGCDYKNEFDIRNTHLFTQDRVDGIILLTPMFEEILVPDLKKASIPYVLIDNQDTSSSGTSVLIDNYTGAYEAVNHLAGLGHKDIVHICGLEEYLSSQERKKGYLEAVRDKGLPKYPVYKGEFSVESGYRCTKQIFSDGLKPTAIFAADDVTAFGVMQALSEMNLSAPEHVSVVGFDDHPLSRQLKPYLTTVCQSEEDLARRAVEELISAIEGKGIRSTTIRIRPQLIVRESTGPCLVS